MQPRPSTEREALEGAEDKKLRETAVPHYVERGQKKDQKFWDEILGDDSGA